ncbi:glycoside hydrolase family 99-like domain-containing protein [Glaciecola sp. KUL10]|uniref:glycosyltransferase WbsX family protein n=1 Tax=Glaciecola sp. (strain KUL10) TaxID=2161813 RepID=UPI000D78C588|nr:glycoside hydrolase family 99-like domain-containing protein [Glaciecola sp. KUL10]GBL04238.1 hypothetical protein KUL10_15440 [Glaciecola sp. KUL10]
MKKDTQIIAFYLPQFHSIPENDKWWGEGFTEWTNTTKAKRLFPKHHQPRTPLNNNFYNLLEPETLRWQASLAKNYGVSGFCFYHYWFNGKLLLEKPAELLLSNPDIDMPFSFCWANEPWTRAWTGGDKDVLIEQNYGSYDEWDAHLEYLMPFFLDPRYTKLESKPIFTVYSTSTIPNCDIMLEYMNKQAIEKYGLKGIYFIEMMNTYQNRPCSNETSAVIEFEPMNTIRWEKSVFNRGVGSILKLFFPKSKPNLLSYDSIWRKIIDKKPRGDKKTFPGAFIDWDNSARKANNATILLGGSVRKFSKYFDIKLSKARNEYEAEYIFINAWNEWAEGTYLEPDDKNHLSVLEAINSIVKNKK